MITVKINSEEELVRITTELLFISVNLRRATRDWHEHFGSERKTVKEKWEKRMDKLISALEVNQFNQSEKYTQLEIKVKEY